MDIESFVNNSKWIFAKTYARTWPHEYTLLKDAVNKELFFEFVITLNEQGFKDYFYATERIYFKYKRMIYWTMDDSIETTTLINRTYIDLSYPARKAKGTLPDTRHKGEN